MRGATKQKTLNKYVSARLTDDEEERVSTRAETAGLTKSQWCRQALLQALDVASDTRLLLSELSALRALVLALQLHGLKGNELSDEHLKQLIEKSEREKFAMADKRIHKFRSQIDAPSTNNNSGEAA